MPTHLSQIRARNVLAARAALGPIQGPGGGGNVVKGIPEKIINHGLLAAAADAVARNGESLVWGAISSHLADPEIDLVDPQINNLHNLLSYLVSPGVDSRRLRLITAETMEWLNFARRLI